MQDILSLSGKRWVTTEDPAKTSIVETLQTQRGLATPYAANLYADASLYPEGTKAAERIKRAAEAQEKVAIFGDYDCDGVTSTAQMVRALRLLGIEPTVRLPHRVHDGYGLKPGHIEEFKKQGVHLIITVDTGVSAHQAIDLATEAGMDVIVLDHHHVVSVPGAYAIVHPALSPGFPEHHPSAAGVVFAFLHALLGETWEGRNIDLSLAAIGTVADLVPLLGINRQLVQAGIAAISALPSCPLRTFIESCVTQFPVSSTDIGFRIAPRINAAGRMANPEIALKAVLEGGEYIADIHQLNSFRQEETRTAFEKALAELQQSFNGNIPAFLSIGSSQYKHGIVGLLSGRLTETFARPSMAVCIEGGLCTASLRSTPHYHITEALSRHKELLISYGGHAQAAGATFKVEDFLRLEKALMHDAELHLPQEHRTPTLTVDAALSASDLTLDLCDTLKTLEPFGQGNPEPVFMIEDIAIQNMRTVGALGKHLQGKIGNAKLIGFNMGEWVDQVNGEPVDIAVTLSVDSWQGRESVQLMVKDVRVKKGAKVQRCKGETLQRFMLKV